MEEIWKIAFGVAGLGAVAVFFVWSLYREWFKLSIFQKMTKEQQYNLFRLFFVLTFLFGVGGLVTYLAVKYIDKPAVSVDEQTISSENQLAWVTFEEIKSKDSLIKSFVVDGAGEKIQLRFVSPGWGLDFSFNAPTNIEAYKVRNRLMEHFSLRDHIKIDLREFPTRTSGSYWDPVWILTANGREITTGRSWVELNPTLSELNIKDEAILRFRIKWGLAILTSGGSGKDTGVKTKVPPELEL